MQGQPQYEIQVGLPIGLSYRSGHLNQLANETCCSSAEIPPACGTSCSEIHINLCFRETVNDTNVIGNDTACTLGEMMFALPTNTDDYIVFGATEGATTTTYPVSQKFKCSLLFIYFCNTGKFSSAFCHYCIEFNKTY